MIRVLLAGARLQFLHMRTSLDDLMVLLTLPLFTVAFLAIFVEGGRRDLAAYAVVGTSVMAVWSSALFVSGEIIDVERQRATLEATATTPAPLALLVAGRVAVVASISLVGVPESMLVARVAFGIPIGVPHPLLFLAALAATAFAVIGTSTVITALFVLGRSVLTFQNSMTYPFYILSGAVVPVSLLPAWIRPLSRVYFLSWSSDLLRSAMLPAPARGAAGGLAAVLLLGLAAFGGGLWLVGRVTHRLRVLGTMSYS
ncbi:ABC transporter permease [Kitasatospora viridis]|uniref:ABC-2 type transport system permease protein n=1 Tax=Kitasatospora viridis TaxID=281105 RepID=A0A561UHU7_9ACTN|nr:ABC transporter permease [Kitasatospora viridis]TWF98933.1 ABC-2 type transport system permease protein [Kitasatospora viridis]